MNSILFNLWYLLAKRTISSSGSSIQQDTSPISSNLISNFLKSNHNSANCNWATFTSTFESTPLIQHIIDSVLLQLKEPVYARKALSFFYFLFSLVRFHVELVAISTCLAQGRIVWWCTYWYVLVFSETHMHCWRNDLGHLCIRYSWLQADRNQKQSIRVLRSKK
jgi:hypothetical protein